MASCRFLPISEVAPPNISAISLHESGEKLVCVSTLQQNEVLLLPQYFLRQVPGAIDKIYMRETVYRKLCEAQNALPCGYKLVVFDAWRPAKVQKYLFYKQYKKLSKEPKYKTFTKQQLYSITCEFVSFPSMDPNKPFVHSTGGAVDLSIVNECGKALDMGTEFDDFTLAAHATSFEGSSNHVVRDNRRLLYSVMTSAGFTGYYAEWWHFDYGDPFWASSVNRPAMYAGIYDEPEDN